MLLRARFVLFAIRLNEKLTEFKLIKVTQGHITLGAWDLILNIAEF